MSIHKEIILRHQAKGHVRFKLPGILCEKHIAEIIEQNILGFEGVYRVKVYVSQQKLSIRYTEELCDFSSLARQLFDMFAAFEKKGFPEQVKKSKPRKSRSVVFKKTAERWTPLRWVKGKYTETKETAQAVGVLAKFGLKNKSTLLKNPEKTFIDFFNDVLVLYLIKVHWHIITQHWMLKPWRYRSEWLATFYMMYLLMRSKIPKK